MLLFFKIIIYGILLYGMCVLVYVFLEYVCKKWLGLWLGDFGWMLLEW